MDGRNLDIKPQASRMFTRKQPNHLRVPDISEHRSPLDSSNRRNTPGYKTSSKAIRRSAGVSQSSDFRGDR
jgi:hypothetical protein